MVISLLIFFSQTSEIDFKHLFNRETDKITIRHCRNDKNVSHIPRLLTLYKINAREGEQAKLCIRSALTYQKSWQTVDKAADKYTLFSQSSRN